MELHPDTNPDKGPEAFVELNETYSVLGDAVSKVRYDKLYDHYILKQPLTEEPRFRSREQRRTRSVHRKASKGRAKGTKRANQSKESAGKKIARWAFFDFLALILEGIINVIASGI